MFLERILDCENGTNILVSLEEKLKTSNSDGFDEEKSLRSSNRNSNTNSDQFAAADPYAILYANMLGGQGNDIPEDDSEGEAEKQDVVAEEPVGVVAKEPVEEAAEEPV
jgi:hypothetical protein